MVQAILAFIFLNMVLVSGVTSTRFDSSIPLTTSQVITVVPVHGLIFKARVTMWQRCKGGWKKVSHSLDSVIGRNGFALFGEKREGDGKTPAGAYKLGTAFGYTDSLKTKMPYHRSTQDDIWVDDVHSQEYNRLVSLKDVKDAKSFEYMKRQDDLYKAGLVIEYNTDPVVPGNGSAIFLHIWRNANKPTAGCVALSEENVLKILRWLDTNQNPLIIMDYIKLKTS